MEQASALLVAPRRAHHFLEGLFAGAKNEAPSAMVHAQKVDSNHWDVNPPWI